MDAATLARAACASAALLAAGCVPVPEYQYPRTVSIPRVELTPGEVFPGLDPGGKEVSGLHFQVRAYGSERAQAALAVAEERYARIMLDTGLYSFMPRGLYSVVVYGARDEYLKKTQQPEWSGGVTVGNAIYGYEGPHLGPILAHELTHLIFHDYMGGPRPDLRWFNEGLAVYEERVTASESGLAPALDAALLRQLRDQPIAFERMADFTPASERDRLVSLWYVQAADVVRFMLERGGRNGFNQLLVALRERRPFDEAVRSAYPGVWSGLADLEAAWRRSL